MTRGSNWRDRAACLDMDSNIFVGERATPGGWSYAPALAVCAGCDVTEECLEFAVSSNITVGVWGGLTPNERRPHRVRYLKRNAG